MVIQEINMVGSIPLFAIPIPDHWHINSSVPKTKFYVCEWDERLKKGKLLRNAKLFQRWNWVGCMIETVKVTEQKCKIISKVGLSGIRWDE